MWGRAGRAGAGTKKSQVGEMWLRSTLSRVPERPPSTPGIHSLTQQLLLSTFSVAGTLIGPGSIAMNNQTQILPQGAYNLGVSIQWLQVFFLGHLEFSVRGPLRISVHKHTAHTHGHKWLISAHAYTRFLERTHTHTPCPALQPPLPCSRRHTHGQRVHARSGLHPPAISLSRRVSARRYLRCDRQQLPRAQRTVSRPLRWQRSRTLLESRVVTPADFLPPPLRPSRARGPRTACGDLWGPRAHPCAGPGLLAL